MTQALGNALRAHKFERMEAMSPIVLDALSPRKPSDTTFVHQESIVPANNVYFPVGDDSDYNFDLGETNSGSDTPTTPTNPGSTLGDLTGGGSTQFYLPDHSLTVKASIPSGLILACAPLLPYIPSYTCTMCDTMSVCLLPPPRHATPRHATPRHHPCGLLCHTVAIMPQVASGARGEPRFQQPGAVGERRHGHGERGAHRGHDQRG